jgi:hypothetical protein
MCSKVCKITFRYGVTPQGKRPLYPLDRRLTGPRSRSGHCETEKKSLASAGNRTLAV